MDFVISQQQRRRLAFLSAVLAGCVILVVGRLIYWQVAPAPIPPVPTPQSEQSAQFLPRGTIFDRNGYVLAVDVIEYEISASPTIIKDAQEVARQLAPLLARPAEELYASLADKDRSYVQLARRVPFEVGQAVMKRMTDLDERGIRVEYRPKRVYPQGAVAGPVVGFVNEERQGYYGVEGQLHALLTTTPGSGVALVIDPQSFVPLVSGSDVVLTLDRNVQAVVERELAETIRYYEAEAGTVVVMDPATGAILAMASLPSYDPNDYSRVFTETPALFNNSAVNRLYEPGSVLKVVTMAAGLDTGEVTPQSTYFDTGVVVVEGRAIENWDRLAHGQTSMLMLLEKSLNVGAVHVVLELGADRFYHYVRRFGFGKRTGIELYGELRGILRTPSDPKWHPSDLATNSFGQGIGATPIQVITAVGAVANRGVLVRPHIVDRYIRDGVVTRVEPAIARRVIAAQTAKELTDMLVAVVEDEVTAAAIPGYRVAGKTGTSQIPVEGGYDPRWTIASFVGYAPADDPRFIILVKVDKPRLPQGAKVAAPLFKEIARFLLDYLDVPPDAVRLAMAGEVTSQ